MSFKPQVKVVGEESWHTNGLVFATLLEALASAHDLACRWFLVTEWGAVEVDDAEYPVNYSFVNGVLEAVPESKGE